MTESPADIISDIKQTKEFLIYHNPSKLIKSDTSLLLEEYIVKFGITYASLTDLVSEIPNAQRPLATDTFSLWLLRSSQFLLNKKIDTIEFEARIVNYLLTKNSVDLLLQYTIDFWADGSAALGSALKDMFTKLLKLLKIIYTKKEYTQFLSTALDHVLQIPSTLKVQYFLIEALSDELDLYHVLQLKPNFIDSSLSLMWSDELANAIGRCISSLMINIYNVHFKKDPSNLEQWINIWKGTTMKYLVIPKFSKSVELYLLRLIFKSMPQEAFSIFMKDLTTTEPSCLIVLLKIGQELGIEEEPFHEDKLISIDTIKTLLDHDTFKLSAFEVLAFSSKKSRPVKSYIYEIIKQHLTIFFVDSEVETRNYFASSFKKFIIRLRDSCYSLNRDALKLQKAKKFPGEQKEKLEQVKEAEEFLKWIINFLQIQLIPGSQYQRNDLACQLLRILIESGIDDWIDVKYYNNKDRREYPFTIHICEQNSTLRLLMDNLSNKYDDIRKQINYILLVSFDSVHNNVLYSEIDWQQLFSRCNELLKSYQTSDIGAAIMEFLFLTSFCKEAFVGRIIQTIGINFLKYQNDPFSFVNEPVTGEFTSLSLILKHHKKIEISPQVTDITKKCIQFAKTQWKIVQDIMCHDASDEILPQKYLQSGIPNQKLLSYAFRAVKESANLLNSIILCYSLEKEQLCEIGDLLIEQLFTIRHSGAFQSILPCFLSLCERARKENPKQLDKWLRYVIEQLDTKTQHITRRSGGIPFLLTTILATEKDQSRTQLEFVFENLFRIVSLPITEFQDKIDLPQINAYNCLKAIFIESKLSSACVPYISKSLSLALSGFTSDIWAIRNCSMMLFTSLQNRIFGKIGKNSSAHHFFSKFSGIREILIEQFEKSMISSKGANEENITLLVEPTFLILNLLLRLKPTSGYDGLDFFKEKVIQLLGNENWKIREMAARVFVALCESPVHEITDLLAHVSLSEQNKLHGSLLATKFMVQSLNDQHESQAINQIGKFLLNHITLFAVENPSFISAYPYFQTLEILFKDINLMKSDKKNIYLTILGNYFVKNNQDSSLDGGKQLCLATILSILLKNENTDQISDICSLGLNSDFFSVQQIALEFLLDDINGQKQIEISNEIINDLRSLFENTNALATLKAPVLHIIQSSENNFDFETLLNYLPPTVNEETRLATIELLGSLANKDNVATILSLSSEFVDESKPINARLSGLKCLINTYSAVNNLETLMELVKLLHDDDDEVRDYAANWLNKYVLRLSSWQIETSSSVTFRLVLQKIPNIFSKENISQLVWDKYVKTYMDQAFSFLELRGQNQSELFEYEKDNQYRFDIVEQCHYIDLIKKIGIPIDGMSEYVRRLQSMFSKHLEEIPDEDKALDWVSSPDILGHLIVFYYLTSTFALSNKQELVDLIKQHKLHPIIIDYAEFGIHI